MQIEINGDAEELVRASLASGEFESAAEAIAAMVRTWAAQHPTRGGVVPQLDPDTDIHALVAEQGVLPFDPATPAPDFWPEDESADEFLASLAMFDETPRKTGHDNNGLRGRRYRYCFVFLQRRFESSAICRTMGWQDAGGFVYDFSRAAALGNRSELGAGPQITSSIVSEATFRGASSERASLWPVGSRDGGVTGKRAEPPNCGCVDRGKCNRNWSAAGNAQLPGFQRYHWAEALLKWSDSFSVAFARLCDTANSQQSPPQVLGQDKPKCPARRSLPGGRTAGRTRPSGASDADPARPAKKRQISDPSAAPWPRPLDRLPGKGAN